MTSDEAMHSLQENICVEEAEVCSVKDVEADIKAHKDAAAKALAAAEVKTEL